MIIPTWAFDELHYRRDAALDEHMTECDGNVSWQDKKNDPNAKCSCGWEWTIQSSSLPKRPTTDSEGE